MGNSIFRRLFGKKEVRILIMGLDAAGKTTCLYQMKLGEVVTTIPTIGFNIETVNIRNIVINTWDVGGRCPMRPLYRHYYQNTQGVVYVIDSSDRDRFDYAMHELNKIVSEDELDGTPVLILANKQDLPNVLSTREIASECTSMLGKRPWNLYGVCATTPGNNSGLPEAFEWLVSTIEAREKQKFAENWYPTTKHETTGGIKEKKQITGATEKKSFINSFIESLKIMIK